MGVPVITLKGSHYVSRMSTAVLAGAKLMIGLQIQRKIIFLKQKCSSAIVFLTSKS